ncbi:AraC family transcriptional regulator [Chryseobacterium nematophagum]|uniref:AraC family transcriptional regulator n=1 Tax=Chryseobacterium nematophagum TaxID=2305228 RepID=A0A3M7LD46_9FLAO|nr:AraC family transcriptional regulator [Chryseobacterium nematophagum]RMZ60673.1 AraC family transcriptional regulator [Chryseobacterium nematophagum]
MYKILLLSFVFYASLYFPQSIKNFYIPDSLKNKTFEQLEKSYGTVFRSGNKSILYANTFLAKAKKEKNIIKQIDGYFLLFTKSDKELEYIDSIQSTIKASNNADELSYGNYKIGNIYFNSNKYKKALPSYLSALNYARKNDNIKNIVLIKNAIGKIKYLTYDYEEALKIFKENYSYIKSREKQDPNNYLDILYSLTLAYKGVVKYDSAYAYANLGKSKCLVYNKKYYFRAFDLAGHIIEYHLKDYQQSVDGLKNNIDFFQKYDHANLGITYMYLSLNFQKLKDRSKYLYYFDKMDSLQKGTNFIDPKMIDLYKNSLQYYEGKGDKKKQIYLIDRVIKLNDTIYKSNYEFAKEIHQKFDTPELLEQKEKLISNLDKRNTTLYGLLGGGLLLLLVFIYLYNVNRKKLKVYREQAQKLVDLQNEISTTDKLNSFEKLNAERQGIQISELMEEEKTNKTKNQIPENVRQALIIKLHEFEEHKTFTTKNITLYSLSKDFETNRDYLSKGINELKGKNFSNYLSELRINFIIGELKNNKKLRLKTIAAIAEDAGFNNVESFTKAFKHITGTLPSYFVKALRDNNN